MTKKKYLLDKKEIIGINGEDFHLRIRSNNIEKPLVLILHGGPGCPDRHLVMKHLSRLAEDCIIVAWDQRGAGAAYNRKKAKKQELTKEIYVEDTYKVVSYLCKKYNKEKLVLIGHSYGSQLGIWFLEKYPELVHSYVGIGQFIDMEKNEDISFKFTLDEAEKRKDKKAIKKLNKIGPPEKGFYKDNKMLMQRKYLHKYGGAEYGSKDSIVIENLKLLPVILKEYSIFGVIKYLKGLSYCLNSPLGKNADNLLDRVKKLKVPVFLFLGHHDYNCPYCLAEQWYNNLDCPYKKLVWFEKSAHSPQFEEPDLWCDTFVKEVLEKLT